MQKHTHIHAYIHTLCMSGTRSSKRKLQHNDKVWEHNGPSRVQTEARTSLALKGQQASPSFYSSSDDCSPASSLRWPLVCKCGSHPEIPSKYENAEQQQEECMGRGGVLVLEVELLVDVVSQGLAWLGPAWPGHGSTSILIRDLWSGASLRNIC